MYEYDDVVVFTSSYYCMLKKNKKLQYSTVKNNKSILPYVIMMYILLYTTYLYHKS